MAKIIEIWGTYPPPIGGVSIHVFRLIHRLHDMDKSIILKNFGKVDPDFEYIKTVSNVWIEFLKLPFIAKRLIHLHSNNIKVFMLFLLFGFRHKIGITIHNKNLIEETSFFKRIIIKCFFKHIAFIILNDSSYRDKLVDSFHCIKERIYILPAFLPPINFEYRGLNEDILKFRKQHSFLLSANAYKLRLDAGIDVYGFDMLIELVKALKVQNIDVGLIFCLPLIGNIKYYKKCLSIIEKYDLCNNIMIVHELIPNGFEVWKLSDLFVRPTSTDIEGLSVKEALYCGTPAIASNVCTRPAEAMLFKSRDLEDLKIKVLEYYKERKFLNKETFSFDDNSVEKILQIYKSII